MYQSAPSVAELAAFGLRLEDVAASMVVEVWPDVFPVYKVFEFLGTQWRTGAAGPTGLDYNILYRKLDRMGLSPEQYDDFERDIQVMEAAALTCMREQD